MLLYIHHIPIVCIHYSALGRSLSNPWVLWPKLSKKKLSSERHWSYAHAVLRMQWNQPLICEVLQSKCMKHSLQLHPKEEEDSWLREDMFPYPSMIYFSCQPHHFVVVSMELCVPFESPLIHKKDENVC